MKKIKEKKYAIIRFEDDSFEDNQDNWMLIRYNLLKDRGLFAYEDGVVGNGQYVFDKDAKVIYRTDLNKKSIIVKKDSKTSRLSCRFRINTNTYFLLYVDPDDEDVRFKMESDAAAILYAMNIQ